MHGYNLHNLNSELTLISDVINGKTSYLTDGVFPTANPIGDFSIATLDRAIEFSKQESASKCQSLINDIEGTMRGYFRHIQDIYRAKDEALAQFVKSKEQEITSLNDRGVVLGNQVRQLMDLVAELGKRVTQERVLGAPLTSKNVGVAPDGAEGRAEWPQVIQSNVTRVGAILLTVFLVTIWCPNIAITCAWPRFIMRGRTAYCFLRRMILMCRTISIK